MDRQGHQEGGWRDRRYMAGHDRLGKSEEHLKGVNDGSENQDRAGLKELFTSFFRQKKSKNTKIDMGIMDIRWLLQDKQGFLDFAPVLETYERDNLF